MGQCHADVPRLLYLCHFCCVGPLPSASGLCVWLDAGTAPIPIPLQAEWWRHLGEDSHLWGQLTELLGGDLLWPCPW